MDSTLDTLPLAYLVHPFCTDAAYPSGPLRRLRRAVTLCADTSTRHWHAFAPVLIVTPALHSVGERLQRFGTQSWSSCNYQSSPSPYVPAALLDPGTQRWRFNAVTALQESVSTRQHPLRFSLRASRTDVTSSNDPLATVCKVSPVILHGVVFPESFRFFELPT